jgi:integrase
MCCATPAPRGWWKGGIDIRRVQMWLGHQTLTMTMRYAHLATHDLDSCVVVLERCPPSRQ